MLKLYWCETAPWERAPEQAAAFCDENGFDRSEIWDGAALARYAAGRFLLCRAWRAFAPEAPLPEIVCVGRGKPVFSGGAALHWNLSHSGGAALCAAASFPVGADVERITAADPALLRLLPAEEQRWCAGVENGFFTLWTAKESLVKLRGEGLSELLALPSLVRDGALCRETAGRFWQPVSLGIRGYAAAVASALPAEIDAVEQACLPVSAFETPICAPPDN